MGLEKLTNICEGIYYYSLLGMSHGGNLIAGVYKGMMDHDGVQTDFPFLLTSIGVGAVGTGLTFPGLLKRCEYDEPNTFSDITTGAVIGCFLGPLEFSMGYAFGRITKTIFY